MQIAPRNQAARTPQEYSNRSQNEGTDDYRKLRCSEEILIGRCSREIVFRCLHLFIRVSIRGRLLPDWTITIYKPGFIARRQFLLPVWLLVLAQQGITPLSLRRFQMVGRCPFVRHVEEMQHHRGCAHVPQPVGAHHLRHQLERVEILLALSPEHVGAREPDLLDHPSEQGRIAHERTAGVQAGFVHVGIAGPRLLRYLIHAVPRHPRPDPERVVAACQFLQHRIDRAVLHKTDIRIQEEVVGATGVG